MNHNEWQEYRVGEGKKKQKIENMCNFNHFDEEQSMGAAYDGRKEQKDLKSSTSSDQ